LANYLEEIIFFSNFFFYTTLFLTFSVATLCVFEML
jgi:hypothetical protein